MLMRIRLLLYLLFVSFAVHAQRKITGRVLAQDSITPVASANVYLSNTSTGAVTDDKGFFTFQKFPEGRYELIVSCVGYETFQAFVRSDQLLDNFVILMQPKVAELQEVVIKNDPYDPYGMSRYGNFFMDNFIGTGAFAQECKLVNPEVLRFRFSSKTNVARITASDQLIIENNSLGYILKYTLTKFEYNIITKNFIYAGFPFFTEMQTTNKRLEKKWMENRDAAYKGSLLHFMRSTYEDKLKEEQFEVRQWVKVSDAEKKRVREMYDRQKSKFISSTVSVISPNGKSLYVEEKDTSRIINRDTLAYFQSVMKQIKKEDILIDVLLASKNISAELDPTSKELTFDNKIEVVYLPKSKDKEYQRSLPLDQRYQLVVSNLFNGPEHLNFLPNGSFTGGNAVGTAGYWSWSEKMCNKLPYDYLPMPKDATPQDTKNKRQVKSQVL
jgi:hypothetical protein